MTNYLIITLGTRDVQLRRDLVNQPGSGWQVTAPDRGPHQIQKNGLTLIAYPAEAFPDFYMVQPRSAGQLISDNLTLFAGVLAMPLITPTLNRLLAEGKHIDTVLLIYTNQDQEQVKSHFYQNDTYYFVGIIETLLRSHSLTQDARIDPYEISKQVADIDVQYRHFGLHNQELFDNTVNVGEVFLLPQGGIDQINHAITLQLIQAFTYRVRLFQQPEAGEAKELYFTHLFLNDLNRPKLRKHIDDYDFGYVTEELTEKPKRPVRDLTEAEHKKLLAKHLAQYAAKRLALQHNQLADNVAFLLRQPALESLYPMLQQPMDTDEQKLLDLYAAVKISDRQMRYAECLWKLFCLNEALFKVYAEGKVGRMAHLYDKDLRHNTDINTRWVALLNKYSSDLVKMLNQKKIWLNNPGRKAYAAIASYLDELETTDGRLKRLGEKLELLVKLRNDVTHNLGSIGRNQLDDILGNGYNLNQLYSELDAHFQLTEMGDFDLIKNQMLRWV